MARKEENQKLKTERQLSKAQNGGFPYPLPPKITTVFIGNAKIIHRKANFLDASSLGKEPSEITAIAKKMLEMNPQVEKCTVLFEDFVTPNVDGKLVLCSAIPLFESTIKAVKCLSSQVDQKKTLAVLSGNKEWILNLRKECIHGFFTPIKEIL